MAEIRIISTCLVQGAAMADNSFSSNRIESTAWDLQLLLFDTIQKGLLLPKPTFQQEEKLLGGNVIDHLKISLSKTLDLFPPLAGRLGSQKNDNNTVTLFVDCNNLGAQFTHASAGSVTMADILEPTYVPSIVHSFFSFNGVPNWEGIFKPLLAVQVSELADGFFIGCTMNHCVADGTSFWNFFNSWSEISSGSDVVSDPPVFRPWFPDEVSHPMRIPSWDELTLEKFIPPLLTERVFHFTKEVALQTSEVVKKWYADRAKNSKILKKHEVPRNKVAVSSSSRFHMYGNDFGWGKPVAVRSGAGNKFDGKLTLFSGAKDGDIDVEVCLSPEALHAVGKDAEFMEAATTQEFTLRE